MASAAPDRVDTMTTTRPFAPDSVIDLIGRTPLIRLRAFGAGHARRRALRQGGVPEPRRLGQGPRGGVDPARGRAHRPAARRRHDSRRDLRQHRHRLRDDLRGVRLPAQAVHAGQRHAGADAHAEGLRRRAGADRSHGRHRRRHSRGAAAVRRRIRSATSTPTSTTTTPTGARTTRPPGRRSSSRPRAGSRTSSPASAPAARSWASAAGCASSTATSG